MKRRGVQYFVNGVLLIVGVFVFLYGLSVLPPVLEGASDFFVIAGLFAFLALYLALAATGLLGVALIVLGGWMIACDFIKLRLQRRSYD